MKELIQHLVREHLPEIAAKSLRNCHTTGLHSVMLLDTPEHRVRLFVANYNHELWRNKPGRGEMSIAAHPHHCNITMHVVRGQLTNIEYEQSTDPELQPFHYMSGILHSQGGFSNRQGVVPGVSLKGWKFLREGESVYLRADQIHTVHVEKHEQAAWLIYEGKEDPNYLPYSYANHDLEKVDLSGLYQPMNVDVVRELLSYAHLLPA